MGGLSLRPRGWRGGHTLFDIRIGSLVFFLAALGFVLGNAALVYSLLSHHEAALNQVSAIDGLRMTSQRLAVRAMRLSDGAFIPMADLRADIDRFEDGLRALEQGGVLEGREVPALPLDEAREWLPWIQRDWRILHGRLQAIVLGSFTQGSAAERADPAQRLLHRQWIADEAQTLLASINSARDHLLPRLHADRERAQALGGVLVVVDLLVLLAWFLLWRRWFMVPLRALHAASLDLLAGRYDTRIRLHGPGELGQVSRAVNTGARLLRQLIDEIAEERGRLERSDIIFRGLALNSLVGIFLAEEGRFTFVSQKMAEIFGYATAEMTETLPLLGIIAPRERYLVAEAIKASQIRKDGTFRFERHGRRKDGQQIDIEVFGTAIRVGGRVVIIGLAQDVTERKRAESSAQLTAIAYENSSEAIAITDAHGVIIDVNPAYSRMTGYWADEVAGDVLPLLQPGPHNRDFYDDMWSAIHAQGRWEGEYWGRRKSGKEYVERVVMDTAWNHDGSVNCRVVMLSDITEKKQIETEIWNQAHHDPLTQLPNRQYFNERLAAAVAAADEHGETLALLFLDLDLFKEVNDSMGHAVGDQLLVEVARRLSGCTCQKASFVARLGGDEFVVIVSDAPGRAQMDQLCETILARITQPYRLGKESVRISASLGVAGYPDDAEDAETLLRHVDMAMYAAKEQGRDRYHYFDSAMRERARMQRDLLFSLPDAIARNQFFLLYQPIYSLSTGHILQAEILLRWRHPEFGVVCPADFIPYAEERHLIRPLSDWVLGEAARQLARWRAELMPDLRLAINLSPDQLARDPADLRAVLAVLATSGLPRDSVTLECSEALLMDRDLAGGDPLRQWADAGLRFSVGAVSVGLPALLATPDPLFEAIKLEPRMTARLLESDPARIICETTITLAHRLGLVVIAEGVTSRAQLACLQAMGCDAAQGYWLDAPLDQATFEQRLRDPARFPPMDPAASPMAMAGYTPEPGADANGAEGPVTRLPD